MSTLTVEIFLNWHSFLSRSLLFRKKRPSKYSLRILPINRSIKGCDVGVYGVSGKSTTSFYRIWLKRDCSFYFNEGQYDARQEPSWPHFLLKIGCQTLLSTACFKLTSLKKERIISDTVFNHFWLTRYRADDAGFQCCWKKAPSADAWTSARG